LPKNSDKIFYICHDGSKFDRTTRLEMAQKYFDEFLESGETPSRKMLNSMLSVYTKGFRMAQAEEFRQIVFPKNGHQCDHYSYLSLMSMYYRIKALDKCYDTLQEMKSVGLKPDYDIYMLVLRTCKYRKSDFLGVKILKEMCDNGIVADEDVAYPFQEIVESLPDYKPVPSLEPERFNPINPGIGTTDERMIEQANRQRQLMLQNPESLSVLERFRKARNNDYNPHKFHPSNPEFVRNYVNRNRDKWSKLEKPKKWIRPTNYQQGLLSDKDPEAKLVGEKILDFNMKEIQGQFILEGGDKLKPLQISSKFRIKSIKDPPRNEL
jgi:pentatricopeptide repeat protein